MNSMDDLVFAAFLREDEFYQRYSSVVDDTMFEDPVHKICINAYKDYVHLYSQRPSVEELTSEVERYCKRFSFDSDITAQAQTVVIRCSELTYNVDYVRDSFLRFATKNKLTATVLEAAKIIRTKGDELSERDYERIQDMVSAALSIKATDPTGLFLDDVAEDPTSYLKEQSRFDPTKAIPTGIRTFDRAHISGRGPIPGELYVVSAPPGRGKSTFLVNVGVSALLQGKDVAHIFVGDNTESDGVLRYCARLTGVPMPQIMLNSSLYLPAWKSLKENFTLGQLLIGAFPIDSVTVADLRSFITRSSNKRNFDPKVIIVDYIDNCRRDSTMSSYDALGDLYTKLKNLGEEMGLVVWTASQTKIEYWESDNVGLGSLAESSKKQHIVDGVLNLSVGGSDGNLCRVDVAKYRRGTPDMHIDLILDYERMLMKESLPGRMTDAQVSQFTTSAQEIPKTPY